MSEYQYYEFLAIDKPLTAEQQAAIRKLSSRVNPTSTQAVFVYNYGDFRSEPKEVLAKYFDTMLYITNWGTRQLMMRFPKNAVRIQDFKPYLYDNNIEVETVGNYVILDIMYSPEEGWDGMWLEGEGMLSGLVSLREDILKGDLRVLYLAWLQIAQYEADMLEEDEDLTEPPVPPNLKKLSPALRNFIEFFNLDQDLVAAAAQASPNAAEVNRDLEGFLPRLPEEERMQFLIRLLKGEPRLDIELKRRLQAFAPQPEKAQATETGRTIQELIASSKDFARQREAEAKRQAEKARLEKLQKLAETETALWAKLPGLIEQTKASTYDQAVNILKDLHELAQHQNQLQEFREKIEQLKERYGKSQALMRRFRDAQLL